MGLTSGTKLGPYEIVSPLGAGGMGEVYRAHDSRLDRDVAAKVLPAKLFADPLLKQRLEREAKAVSKCSTLSRKRLAVDGVPLAANSGSDCEEVCDGLRRSGAGTEFRVT